MTKQIRSGSKLNKRALKKRRKKNKFTIIPTKRHKDRFDRISSLRNDSRKETRFVKDLLHVQESGGYNILVKTFFGILDRLKSDGLYPIDIFKNRDESFEILIRKYGRMRYTRELSDMTVLLTILKNIDDELFLKHAINIASTFPVKKGSQTLLGKTLELFLINRSAAYRIPYKDLDKFEENAISRILDIVFYKRKLYANIDEYYKMLDSKYAKKYFETVLASNIDDIKDTLQERFRRNRANYISEEMIESWHHLVSLHGHMLTYDKKITPIGNTLYKNVKIEKIELEWRPEQELYPEDRMANWSRN